MLYRRLAALALTMCLILGCVSAYAAGFTTEVEPLTDAQEVLRGYEKGKGDGGYVYVQFGRYPYTKSGEVRDLTWRVLAIENGYAFLLNEYCVDAARSHFEKKDPKAWNQYEIFGYMNTTMVERMFTAEELDIVRRTDELGWLFILDNKEFMTGRYGFRSIFTEKQWERECALTPYASTIPGTYIDGNGKTTYWSRSCRNTAGQGYQHIVGYDGHISMAGHLRVCGIRPACFVDVTRLDHVKGSGTEKDPFVFEIIDR